MLKKGIFSPKFKDFIIWHFGKFDGADLRYDTSFSSQYPMVPNLNFFCFARIFAFGNIGR